MTGNYKQIDHTADIAFKDISDVVEVMHNEVITRKVAKVKPIGVIKG